MSTTRTDAFTVHTWAFTAHTWADGFGVWHARVTEYGPTSTVESAARSARSAIVAALSEREGPKSDPASVRVTLESGPNRDGTGYLVYDFREVTR